METATPNLTDQPAQPVQQYTAPSNRPVFNSPSNPQELKNELKGLALLEVGIFEITFVVIILLLFFGVLNYFNILSLSSLYPGQLGWLPHQTIKISKGIVQSPAKNANHSLPNPVKLANEASDSELRRYITISQIPTSDEKNNMAYGIFSGFDSKEIQIINKSGPFNFTYNDKTPFSKFTAASSNPSSVGFQIVHHTELLQKAMFGTIIQIIYDSSSSAGLTAKEIYIFNKI